MENNQPKREIESINMNLKELVWDNSLDYGMKLDTLSKLKLELETKITNNKKLPFDIYFPFAEDFDKLKTANQKWKQVQLALEIIKLTRRWTRKYEIDLRKTGSGELFIDFFKDTIFCSKNFLCNNGINFYVNEKYTYKTMVIWAYKLMKLDLVSPVLYNEFLEKLEGMSYGR